MAFFGGTASRLSGLIFGAKALLGLVLLAMVACSPIFSNHGYVPADDELAQLQVGVDTRDSVAQKVGRPSLEGLLNDQGWFYVQSRFRQVGPKAPVEIDRQVVALTFAENGKLENVERFGLEKGRVVPISRRVTQTNVRSAGVVRQLMSSVGRLRADQLVD